MADAGPDYDIERMKIEVQISQLRHNALASTLRRRQLQADIARIDQQIAATNEAIAEQQAAMESLPTGTQA